MLSETVLSFMNVNLMSKQSWRKSESYAVSDKICLFFIPILSWDVPLWYHQSRQKTIVTRKPIQWLQANIRAENGKIVIKNNMSLLRLTFSRELFAIHETIRFLSQKMYVSFLWRRYILVKTEFYLHVSEQNNLWLKVLYGKEILRTECLY